MRGLIICQHTNTPSNIEIKELDRQHWEKYELENIIDPDIHEKIIHISDQILQAVISHTFDCIANMLAERDIENEEAEEDI